MSDGGGVLLFRTGGVGFALPLDAVARLGDWGAPGPFFDPVTGEEAGARLAGETHEGLAYVRSGGLTLRVPMDTIVGIESSAAVHMRPVPRLLSPCRWLAGLVEAGQALYLLIDPRKAVGERGGARDSAERSVVPEGPKAQEDAER